MEVPVRRLLLGAEPGAVADPSAMADPSVLAEFVEYARTQRDYSLA
jgi:acetoacetyl-CoA synthetase